MNWRVVAASAIGTSHLEVGGTCEDRCLARVQDSPDRQPLLSIFVADGAGSAAHGGEGAGLAITASSAFLSKKCALPSFLSDDSFALECMMAVRECIHNHAENHGRKSRDYACTFLGVLSSSNGTLVMQIGDGGIVVDVGNGLEVPVIPMQGEFANMTHFVTDDDAIATFQSKSFAGVASRVAVFTDGIQRLALNMATNTVHEPFFAPFFTVLSTATSEQEDRLQCALAEFLSSGAVNERTDDDKTLALAALVE